MLAVQTVDCILLDLSIRDPGAEEACQRMKLAPGLRDVPLIMTASAEDRSVVVDGLGAGADDFIATASGLDVLKARVHAQLRRKQFEDENRRVREELLRSELQASEERAARNVAEARAAFAEELERKNRELEAFSYSVSHDLRSPLRSIDGFSLALLEEHSDVLDESGKDYLRRVRAAAQRMGELIDDLLQLSRVNSADLRRDQVSVSAVAQVVVDELRRKEPERKIDVTIAEGLTAEADSRLLRVLFENLLGNAWKFTMKTAEPRVEIGADPGSPGPVYFVRDNGAGFDMSYAKKLFTPFQRLHAEADFPGTGIGLATVRRIVDRHGGRVWAEGAPRRGATVFFTLPPASARVGPR
jgi:light-regulated signal transduction histidine kinase (bacteriophytochrome)